MVSLDSYRNTSPEPKYIIARVRAVTRITAETEGPLYSYLTTAF
jgi:hypothetical protein